MTNQAGAPRDVSRVNLDEEDEIAYWSRKWGVTPNELVAAVDAVGESASAVASHLGKQPDLTSSERDQILSVSTAD